MGCFVSFYLLATYPKVSKNKILDLTYFALSDIIYFTCTNRRQRTWQMNWRVPTGERWGWKRTQSWPCHSCCQRTVTVVRWYEVYQRVLWSLWGPYNMRACVDWAPSPPPADYGLSTWALPTLWLVALPWNEELMWRTEHFTFTLSWIIRHLCILQNGWWNDHFYMFPKLPRPAGIQLN